MKETVQIPVIGKGNILCHQDDLDMIAETGCDGVMVSRGVLGAPWVFQPAGVPDSLSGRLPVIRRHLELAATHLDAVRLLFRIKNHFCRYLTGLPGAVSLRQQITECSNGALTLSFPLKEHACTHQQSGHTTH